MKIIHGYIAIQTGAMGRECLGIASTREAAMAECHRQLLRQQEEEYAFSEQMSHLSDMLNGQPHGEDLG